MGFHSIMLDEASEKMLVILKKKTGDKLDSHAMVRSCIMFAGFMMACSESDELFKENLNNVMSTSDWKKFFTSEPG